jgi:hypothetical protein
MAEACLQGSAMENPEWPIYLRAGASSISF